MSRYWIVFALLGIVAHANAQSGSVAPQGPMKPEAKKYLQVGVEYYQQGRYEEAIEALKKGHELDPRSEFMYALGQAERRRGNCRDAIPYYQQFLDHAPSPRQYAAVRAHIERCQKVIKDQDAANQAQALAAQREAPPPEPVKPAPPPERVPTPISDRTPWYKDWIGGTLCGAGLVTASIGAVLFFKGNGALDSARDRYDHYAAAIDDGKSERNVGIVLLVAGGGLVTAGVVRYILASRRAPAVSVVPTQSGVFVAVSRGF